MSWNTDDLLAAVRRTMFAPDVSDQTDDDVLAFADEVLDTLIAATIRPGREGYWLAHEDIQIVPGTVDYDVPRRALGRTVRGVMAVRPDGDTYPLTDADPLVLRTLWERSQVNTYEPSHYAFEDTKVRLNSTSAASGWVLRIFFLRTPPKLVTVATGSEIVDVQAATTLQVVGTPSSTEFATGALFDVVSGQEPYPVLFEDLVVADFSLGELVATTSAFSLSPMNPPAAVVNRSPAYAVPAETTVYPPIVRSLWPSLVKGTAAACLAALRDPQADAMAGNAEAARRQAVATMSPRDDRRSRAIVGASALRSSALLWGRRR